MIKSDLRFFVRRTPVEGVPFRTDIPHLSYSPAGVILIVIIKTDQINPIAAMKPIVPG